MLKRIGAIAVAFVVSFPVSASGPSSLAIAASNVPRGTGEVTRVLTELAPLISRNRQGPTRASRVYGIVGYSMLSVLRERPDFAALVSEPVDLAAPSAGIDEAIAAVAAGTSVVRKLMPTQLDRTTYAELRDELLAALVATAPTNVDVRSSLVRGAESASAVLARAANDGLTDALAAKYVAPNEPGVWAPTPPGFQGAIDPGWGMLRPYLAETNGCVLPAPPRSGPTEDPFAGAAREVAEVAANLTDEQRLIARFWDDGRGRSSTPSGHWVEIAARAVEAKGISGPETIATLATVTMALSDGVVANWREKYKWAVERPVSVIGRGTPEWNSYLTTPAFPEYPSGHSTISRAAAEVLTARVGEWAFTDPGWGLTPGSRKKFEILPRSFDSFLAAANEAGQSRLYGGIHYGFGIEAGAELGFCVAQNYVGDVK